MHSFIYFFCVLLCASQHKKLVYIHRTHYLFQMVVATSKQTWENDVLNSDTPVLVDFWAEWCGPCRMVSPILEKLGETMSGEIKMVKLNVDENQELAMNYGIRSIPSLLIFREGKEIARTVGAATEQTYEKFVKTSLSN
jgi:thioredoxin 1